MRLVGPSVARDEDAPAELRLAPARGAGADLRGGAVDVRHMGLGLVVGLRDAGAVEGVGGDDVGARLDVARGGFPRSGRAGSGTGCRCRPARSWAWPRKRSPRKSASESCRACTIVPFGPSMMAMRCSNRRSSSEKTGDKGWEAAGMLQGCIFISRYDDMIFASPMFGAGAPAPPGVWAGCGGFCRAPPTPVTRSPRTVPRAGWPRRRLRSAGPLPEDHQTLATPSGEPQPATHHPGNERRPPSGQRDDGTRP